MTLDNIDTCKLTAVCQDVYGESKSEQIGRFEELVKMHKDPGALLAITSKNNNTPLSNCNLCIKILPERWSVRCTASGGETE